MILVRDYVHYTIHTRELTALQELMSETSIQLQTQASLVDSSVSLDAAGRPMISHDISEARRQTKCKPRFAEFACGSDQVFRYAALVTKTIIPKAFWGSDMNFDVVMQRLCHLCVLCVRLAGIADHPILHRCQTYDHSAAIRNIHCAQRCAELLHIGLRMAYASLRKVSDTD